MISIDNAALSGRRHLESSPVLAMRLVAGGDKENGYRILVGNVLVK
jgi:hypothetical protein